MVVIDKASIGVDSSAISLIDDHSNHVQVVLVLDERGLRQATERKMVVIAVIIIGNNLCRQAAGYNTAGADDYIVKMIARDNFRFSYPRPKIRIAGIISSATVIILLIP